MVLRVSLKWRVPIQAVRCGTRISLSSTFPSSISTASSPMRRCFTFQRKSCRAYSARCIKHSNPGGVLFSSNPRGRNEEIWNGQRFGAYHDLEGWRSVVTAAGFVEVTHYYRPEGLPREEQPWLATV